MLPGAEVRILKDYKGKNEILGARVTTGKKGILSPGGILWRIVISLPLGAFFNRWFGWLWLLILDLLLIGFFRP